jgi:hypothetical protein
VVCPGEAERFADAEAGVGEELEQESVRASAVEQLSELVGFEDRDALGCPVWLLGGFEFGDWIVREPAAADGVAADLAERNPAR